MNRVYLILSCLLLQTAAIAISVAIQSWWGLAMHGCLFLINLMLTAVILNSELR